ncbi:MAG: sulfite exporter TauE/SafE family protein [Robiginitomaculum sp.]
MKLIAALAALFFVTAALYASVGFGGGSTYTALLIVFGVDYRLVPIIALACNIAVVSGNSLRYGRAGHIEWARIAPLIALSIPAAWLGARLSISEALFIGLLWIALALAGVRLLLFTPKAETKFESRKTPLWLNLIIGAGIGFYSGLVGIGGGIFLAPILYTLRWGTARQIAATCSIFILVNSLSGMLGQVQKLSSLNLTHQALAFWPILPAVIIGGFIGNHMGVFRLSELWLKRLTGLLILSVAVRLAFKWLALIG